MSIPLAVALSLALQAPAAPAPAPAAAAVNPAVVQQARNLVQLGQKLFAQGAFTEALAQFRAANTLREHPQIWFNIGLRSEEHTSELQHRT